MFNAESHSDTGGGVSRFLLRVGMGRAVALITAVSVVASVIMTSALVWWMDIATGVWPKILFIAVLMPLLIAGVVASLMMRMLAELDAARRQVQSLATTDGLTGAWNRRYFLQMASVEWIKSLRHGTSLAVMMLDVDHFKRVNDTHGHACGDLVLRKITLATMSVMRGTDLFGRYGGEEFVLLLPLTGAAEAAQAAERMRSAVSALRFEIETHSALHVTVSVGVAVREPGSESITELLSRADEALYRAKAAGRDRVVVFGVASGEPGR